ncbi:MAG: hypothetical protein ACRDKG_03395 [Actinomycetota bacterium]
MKGRSRGVMALPMLLIIVLGIEGGTAYIDAGSGSYILQLVVGAFVGAFMAVGVFWRRIRAAVSRRFSRNKG